MASIVNATRLITADLPKGAVYDRGVFVSKGRRIRRPKARLGLPALDQSRAAVLGSLSSPEYNKTRGRYLSDRY